MLLETVPTGESWTLSDREGNLYIYKVIKTKVISPNDLSVLNQETDGKKILTLQTSYPIGTALKRFIVIAELISN